MIKKIILLTIKVWVLTISGVLILWQVGCLIYRFWPEGR